MSLLTEHAPEYVAYRVTADALKADGMDASNELFDAHDEALTKAMDARRAAAEIALHWHSKASAEAHASADQNALDTMYEAGVTEGSLAGSLIYNRIYVATLQLL